ncbi:YugN family protein [Pasteuria penetrans]|uniref:YugN family protein n=1 Tax=Pasteuria penetrans TaxID=86005 RepID=UPI000FC0F411|nr:YugN family protein [Pasteuria penetrans]
MILCQSRLIGTRTTLGEAIRIMKPLGFDLGGAKTNEQGFLDKALDEGDAAPHYYLRFPIRRPPDCNGMGIDDPEAIIEFQEPFVLRHEYRRGNDPSPNKTGIAGVMIDQFQSPLSDENLPISRRWVHQAQATLLQLERLWTQGKIETLQGTASVRGPQPQKD